MEGEEGPGKVVCCHSQRARPQKAHTLPGHFLCRWPRKGLLLARSQTSLINDHFPFN